MGFFKWLSDLFGFSSENEVVKAQAPKAEAPVVSAPKLTKASLGKLTKVQLLEHADKNNIKVKRSGSKAEVVKTISSHK